MMMKKMLKPGIKVKRYIFLALASIITMAVAIAKLIDERHVTTIHDKAVFIILIIFSGLVGYKHTMYLSSCLTGKNIRHLTPERYRLRKMEGIDSDIC